LIHHRVKGQWWLRLEHSTPGNWAEVDSQFPYSILTKFMVAEVSLEDAVDPPLDNDSSLQIAEII